MKSYDDEILADAIHFLEQFEEMILKALADIAEWGGNDIEDLDQAFHESIEPSFTAKDALYIMKECHNPADADCYGAADSTEQALVYQAIESYRNDVWFKLEALYEDMTGQLDDIVPVEGQTVEKTAFDKVIQENTPLAPLPVEKGTRGELDIIRMWLSLADKAGGFWGGYPLGQSYIDARCGSGHGMPDIKEFVDFDHEVREKVPWLAGKYRQDIQARFDEMIEASRPTGRVSYGAISKATSKKQRMDLIIASIHCDKNLTVTDIREIAGLLQYRAQGWPS
jgi:hypothetical protein